MREHIKRLTAFLAVVCLLISLTASFAVVADDAADSEEVRYTKKHVAVVYDDSGSMLDSDMRAYYANYSMQMLISLLDSRDTLTIVPMNKSTVEVDLNSDRQNVLDNISADLNPRLGSGTPAESIRIAVNKLIEKGMQRTDDVSADDGNEDEYWLFVLTDGKFDSGDADVPLRAYAKGYSNLRTVYLGIGRDNVSDLRGNSLESEISLTAFRAQQGNEIIESMRDISGLLSGKYKIDSSACKASSANTLIVDLSKYELSLNSISIIAQNTDVKLNNVKYNGNSLSDVQVTSITPKNLQDIKSAFTALIKNNGSSFFNCGTLELEFDGAIDANNITVLAEPSINITAYIEYKDGSDWKKCDSYFVNENLKPGDKIRIGYEVKDSQSSQTVDLKKYFGSITEKVKYCGTEYDPLAEITLVEGKNEATVSVSALNDTYKMYSSVMLNVLPNPTDFRIESEVVYSFGENPNEIGVEYKIYVDGSLCPYAELSGKQLECAATATDDNGNDVPVTIRNKDGNAYAVIDISGRTNKYYDVSFKVKSDGSVPKKEAQMRKNDTRIEVPETEITSQIFKNAGGIENRTRIEYTVMRNGVEVMDNNLDAYKLTVKATAPDGSPFDIEEKTIEDGRFTVYIDTSSGSPGMYKVTLSAETPFGPLDIVNTVNRLASSIDAELLRQDCTSLSQYMLNGNTSEIIFGVFAEGQELAFDDSISYTVTFDGKDVTKYVTIDGSHLIYIPKSEHFSSLTEPGDKKLVLKVWYTDRNTITDTAEATVTVTKTLFEFVSLNTTNKKIDRFDLDECDATLSFELLRDGIPLTKDELQQALDSEQLDYSDDGTFSWKFWLPCGYTANIEDRNGAGVLTFGVERDYLGTFAWYGSMLISSGEKTFTLTYGDITCSDSFEVISASPFSYIIRIILLIIKIYLILFIIGFFICKRFPSGMFVILDLSDDNVRVDKKKVNITMESKWMWHLQRLKPKHLFMDQPDITKGMLRLTFVKRIPHIKINSNGVYYPPTPRDNPRQQLSTFLDDVYSFIRRGGTEPKLEMTSSELRSLFRGQSLGTVARNDLVDVDDTYFAVNNDNNEIEKIAFFIKK